jgi:hypothetical protein
VFLGKQTNITFIPTLSWAFLENANENEYNLKINKFGHFTTIMAPTCCTT